jgi:hypothetical protein
MTHLGSNSLKFVLGLLQGNELRISRHPNGFLCVMFEGVRRDVDQFRIHVWKKQSFDGEIHDHAWSFDSVCIYGSLQMKTFERGAGYLFDHFVCESKGVGSERQFMLTYSGRQQLIETHNKCIRRGDRYSMKPGELHQIESAHGGDEFAAVTVVKRGAYIKDRTDVYSPSSRQNMKCIPEHLVSLDTVVSEIDFVRHSIDEFVNFESSLR